MLGHFGARFYLYEAFQHLNLNGFSGGYVAAAFWQDDEAVGLAHRAQYARALVADGADFPGAVLVLKKDAALKFGSARGFFQHLGAGGRQHGDGHRIGLAHQYQQGVLYELIERHHDGDWVAGQAEIMGVADLAVGQRAAGFHGDFPEYDLAEFVQQLLHVVGLTDRNAAAGENGVCGSRSFMQRAFE